jgi:hypothetical protein
MLTRTTLSATVALLVAGTGLAAAQTSTSPGTSGAQTQCWDAAMSQVRERSASAGTTTGAAGNRAGASGTVGSASNGTMGSSGRSPAEKSASKPAGMPDC